MDFGLSISILDGTGQQRCVNTGAFHLLFRHFCSFIDYNISH